MSEVRRFVITGLMFALTHLIDRHEEMTVSQVRDYIDERKLFDILEQCLIQEPPLAGLVSRDFSANEKNAVLESLSRITNAVTREEVGVRSEANGLLYLNGLLVQVIQNGVDAIRLD